MNQQSGMEADKEIDRFLQKVKKRDMRQKSILLLGMYALVGSILGFLVQCVAIWYPFYNCVPTSAAVFGIDRSRGRTFVSMPHNDKTCSKISGQYGNAGACIDEHRRQRKYR